MRIGVAEPGYQPGSGDEENFKAICRTISRYYGQWGAASPNCDIVVHPNLYIAIKLRVRHFTDAAERQSDRAAALKCSLNLMAVTQSVGTRFC